jgi:hypothetical protein
MIERQHLPHVSSFRDNPTVFFIACTHKRRKLLACAQSHAILRGVWERSPERDGWWVGHYILMPDHVHFFARRASIARPMADWMKMWKSVSSPSSQPRWTLRHLSGDRRILISICGPKKIMGKNGITWSRMPRGAGLIKEGEEWQYRVSIFDLMW